MQVIEHAAFASWCAFEEEDYRGWRLRFAKGYTKRANSANALNVQHEELQEQISYCESFFRDRGLPPIFRLPSFTVTDSIDAVFANAGYLYQNLSWVMTTSISEIPSNTHRLISLSAPAWISIFAGLTQKRSPNPLRKGAFRVSLLERGARGDRGFRHFCVSPDLNNLLVSRILIKQFIWIC